MFKFLVNNPLVALFIVILYVCFFWFCLITIWNNDNHFMAVLVFIGMTWLTKSNAKSIINKFKLAKEHNEEKS